MRGIVKQYPLVRAIDGADFTVEQGEIHSLLGENGAGKSTLMKILYGMTTPTAGEVRVFGKPVAITRPARPSPWASAWCTSTSCSPRS